MSQTVGLLVGGGPAPGINAVIGAATIRCHLDRWRVLGIERGFRFLMEGDTSHIRPLTLDDVSRIHFQGGSILKTARTNPTTAPSHLAQTLKTLLALGVTHLITIGGDDTCFSALSLERAAKGRLRVVHVPKTIDNDLDLPHGIPTFGFQTARHLGTYAVKNLMEDARTTGHWFIAVAMGRKAGHLALGIGNAAGATLTMIPEEFSERPITLATVAKIVAGAIIKRLTQGREDGVAVVAEGLAEIMDPDEFMAMGTVTRDAHGHVELANLDFGRALRAEVLAQLAPVGLTPTIRTKDLGFELRCADPIPFDMEYCRDLGCGAAEFLLEGGSGAMISIVNGRCSPMAFDAIIDPATQRTRVRMVDTGSDAYRYARRYMIRLEREDIEQDALAARCASVIGLTPAAYRERFASVMSDGVAAQF